MLAQDDDSEDESEDESIMKDLTKTTMTMTTVGDGYLNLMKRSLNEGGGFSHSRKATDVPWN